LSRKKRKNLSKQKNRETPRARDPDTDSEFKIPSPGSAQAPAKPARPARRRQSPRPTARASSGGADWARGRADRAASRPRGRDGLKNCRRNRRIRPRIYRYTRGRDSPTSLRRRPSGVAGGGVSSAQLAAFGRAAGGRKRESLRGRETGEERSRCWSVCLFRWWGGAPTF
jgi:hypothetical protein